MSPMSRSKATAAAVELLREHRARYTSSELQWVVEPLAEALRAGLPAELAVELLRGAENAYSALVSRLKVEAESAELARRIGEGRP